ncbi:MAG: Mur ligase domain-containing protein, partial [Rhizobacter sp.]
MKTVVVFQGGGALGAFGCGAWEVLAPWLAGRGDRVVALAGSSIGALNAAVVRAQLESPDRGVGALAALWRERIATPSIPFAGMAWGNSAPAVQVRRWNGFLPGMLAGNRGLFVPRFSTWNPWSMLQRLRQPLYDRSRMWVHYHLIGICGTAMASLAGMLQARGFKVTGSDQNVYPPMSTQLEALGIEILNGYRAENADIGADITVVGNAISRGNPELEEILNRKLMYRSQAEIVKELFIRGRRSLVIAGTHGKTTTTSIATWVCEVGGLDPSFLVGGIVQNFDASFRVTQSDHLVIEGDEYDTAYFDKKPKFMHYLPETASVNNIEFDHA